ncbi:helix-turn-helix transcriptional regulator [Pollutibacter soli]|uniref:helix-turn-helix domain-containing protein n=1 Tax=Pollutibacter soli TaxID=3034157 RepID=UPI00301409A9
MNKSGIGRPVIASLELTNNGRPVQFVLKTMQEVEAAQQPELHTPHRHNYYTIIWVREGKGRHDIDFRSYEVTDNTLFFISPEQVHNLQMEPGHEGYVMLFTADFVEKNGFQVDWLKESGFFFRCDDVAPLKIPGAEEANTLRQIMHMIEKEYQDRQKFFNEAIVSLLKLFVLECMRIREEYGLIFQERSHAKAQLVKQFKDLLDNKFAQWHKVAEYAAEMHITANYLNEVLSTETGMSAKDFILNRIMLEAKRFATYSNTSAKEVAFELGFDDPAHFSKLFRQHQGKSFTSFRTELQQV